MWRVAYQEWCAKSDKGRVTSVMLRMTCQEGHIKSAMSRVRSQEWYVKSDKLRVKSQEAFVKSDISPIIKSYDSSWSNYGYLWLYIACYDQLLVIRFAIWDWLF